MTALPFRRSVRPELRPLPIRLRGLPIDDRGYPVPWFVDWINGKPEFRAMDPDKWALAVNERRCWVCGDIMGAYITFVIGPMCGINRTTAEPGCHLDCADWSATNCPFLTRPDMVRREDDVIGTELLLNGAGLPLARNPGVTLLWTTKRYGLFNDGKGKTLIHLGDPEAVRWYAERRAATRQEVVASVTSGLPALLKIADDQDRVEPWVGARTELLRLLSEFERCYPTP